MNRPPLAFRVLAVFSAVTLMAGFVWWRAWGQTPPTEGQPSEETMFSGTKSNRIAWPETADSGDPPTAITADDLRAYSSKSMAPLIEPDALAGSADADKANSPQLIFRGTKSAPIFEVTPPPSGEEKVPGKPMLLPSTKDAVPLIELDPTTFPSTKSFAPLIQVDPQVFTPQTKEKGE